MLFSRNQLRNSVLQKSSLFGFPQAECRICDDVLFLTHYFANVAFRLVFAWKLSGVLLLKCCVACIKDIYDIIIPLDHCLLQDHKTHSTLNFTNMNQPFAVINLLIVCLSIAGHTTQGYTGSGYWVRKNVRPVQEMFSQRCHAEMIFLLYLLAFKRIAAHQQNAMISTISRS